MGARLEAHWAAENGHIVDMAELPEMAYAIVFQRLKEGSAELQRKWKFDDLGNVSEGADYFIPEKVNERLVAEQTAITMYTQKIRSSVRIPDQLRKV